MRVGIACVALMILVGCGQPAVPVFQAERIADSKAQELAGNTWGNTEYAPKQFTGVAYDSTGLYCNLHGEGGPDLVRITIDVPAGSGRRVLRPITIDGLEFGLLIPADAGRPEIKSGPAGDESKWLGGPLMVKKAFVYGRTFWISWKGLGRDGPPAPGELRVLVEAMERHGKGAAFRNTMP